MGVLPRWYRLVQEVHSGPAWLSTGGRSELPGRRLTRDRRGNSTYVSIKLSSARTIPLAGLRKVREADPDEVELSKVKEVMLKQTPAGAFGQCKLSVARGRAAKRKLGQHTPRSVNAKRRVRATPDRLLERLEVVQGAAHVLLA